MSSAGTAADNEAAATGSSSSPRRVRQVKFAAGLPQVQWLAASSSPDHHHHSSTSAGAEYSLQDVHSYSSSGSSYSSDDDDHYYSDDHDGSTSSFTMSSYSINSWGADLGSSRSRSHDAERRTHVDNTHGHSMFAQTGSSAIMGSRLTSSGRNRRRHRRSSSSGSNRGKSSGASAASAGWWNHLSSLYAPGGSSRQGRTITHNSNAAASSSALLIDSVAGSSSSSTRIVRNMKKVVADAVSSVAVSGVPSIAEDQKKNDAVDDRNEKANSATGRAEANKLKDSIREGNDAISSVPVEGSSSGVVSSILRKSKYKATAITSTDNVEIAVYDDDDLSINGTVGAVAVDQLKEDLSVLAGETAINFSRMVTNLGAGTDEFIDQACQMGTSDMPGYSFSDENSYGVQYNRRKRNKKRWKKKRSQGLRIDKGSSTFYKEGEAGGTNSSTENQEEKAPNAPCNAQPAPSITNNEENNAKNSILDQVKMSAVPHNESSRNDNVKMSKNVAANEETEASHVKGQGLGQSLAESASSMGLFRSRSTPIVSEPWSDPQIEEKTTESTTKGNGDPISIPPPLPLLRSLTLPLNGTNGPPVVQTHKAQGTLMFASTTSNDNDNIIGSTLIVDSPTQPFWQPSNSNKKGTIPTDVTISTIGAESPAALITTNQSVARYPTISYFTPRMQKDQDNDSVSGRNKKRKYCIVTCTLLMTTILWIGIGAFLFNKFPGNSLEEEPEGNGSSLIDPLYSHSSQQEPLVGPSAAPTLPPTYASPTDAPSRAPAIPSPLPTARPTIHPTGAKFFTFDDTLRGNQSINDRQAGCNPGLEALYRAALIDWIGNDSYQYLNSYQVFDLPWRIKAAFDQDPSDEYFGTNGEFTEEVFYLYDKIRAFWELSGMQMDSNDSYSIKGVRGSVLEDDEFSTILSFVSLFDMTFQEATNAVSDVRSVVNAMPGGYENDLLSFHALYYQLGSNTGVFILGDGMLEYLNAYGRGEAPFGLALENRIANMFGQHLLHSVLQLPAIDNAMLSRSGEEVKETEVKYQELLAIALAGYYAAHPSGGNLRGDALCRQFFSQVRDKVTCANNGRYATTTSSQMECAAAWAARIVQKDVMSKEKIGKTRPRDPVEMHRLFDEAFPEIMANYWKRCSPLTEEECIMEVRDESLETSQKGSVETPNAAALAEEHEEESHGSSSSYATFQRSWALLFVSLIVMTGIF